MAQGLSPADAAQLIPASALARIPGCGTGVRPDAVEVLHGGTVNRGFRVDTHCGRFVLRLNDATGELLGANHDREARLHAAAALGGVAPALIYADPNGRFMIMRYIDGPTWEPADFGRRERLCTLGATLRELHAVRPPAVAPFDLGAILRRYSAQLADALPAERGLLEGLMESAGSSLALCKSGARRHCIVHNDLHHSNLVEGERLYLIDWEYAAVADPIFDIACVLAYYPHAAPHAQEFLAAAGLAEEVSPATLARASSLFVHLSFLWYRLRRLSGAVDAADIAAENGLLKRLSA
jgi:aminoglycoside phosphotransferase (APT) family kinase protein